MNKHAEKALELVREKNIKPGDSIPVAVYDEESFISLRNPDGMTLEKHREIAEEVISALKAQGFNAFPVEIKGSEYLEWLGEDLNTSQKRAAFVAQKLKIN